MALDLHAPFLFATLFNKDKWFLHLINVLLKTAARASFGIRGFRDDTNVKSMFCVNSAQERSLPVPLFAPDDMATLYIEPSLGLSTNRCDGFVSECQFI